MFDAQLWAFVGISCLLTITPGADTLLVLRNSVAHGREVGFRTIGGIVSGLFVHAALSALGLSLILTQSARAYSVLKWAGAAYLIWLGLQSLLSALRAEAPSPNPFPVNGEGGSEAPPNPPAEARGDQSREILHPKRVQDDRALGRWGRSEFGPEDVFYYIYAVFHSPTYRERYKEFLKIDFPRVPLTSDLALFGKLVPLGYELVQYHLLEHTKLEQAPVVFPVTGDFVVDKVRYDDQHQRVYINKTQYFEKVPQAVWEFHVGGYQVCQKWLKDRKQRALSFEDIRHYAKTVMALGETIRLMQEIDQAIVEWPIK